MAHQATFTQKAARSQDRQNSLVSYRRQDGDLPGEAQDTRQREIESLSAFNEDDSPADTDRIMEEICEWENLKEAMWRVKANKGSAGIDGMTVDELPDYRDLLVIRDQLWSGAYKPQPVKRVEIPKPDGGVRKLGIPTVAGSVCPASGDAGSAKAVGPDVLR